VNGALVDVCGRAGAAALRDHVARTAFTLAALGGDTQFELDLVETQAGTGVAGDFAVGDSAADTNNHGVACWLVIGWSKYKCESVAFAILD
jgi:hypothetical protein